MKAQYNLLGMVIGVAIIMLLVMAGLFWYVNVQIGSAEDDVFGSLRAREISGVVLSMPVWQCSSDGMLIPRCIDLTRRGSSDFGFARVGVMYITPNWGTRNILLYDNPSVDAREKTVHSEFINVYDPLSSRMLLGELIVEVYR